MKRWVRDLSCKCNYRCGYRFFTEAGWDNIKILQAVKEQASKIESARQCITERYSPSQIFITGGEPLLYPRFAETVSLLSRFNPATWNPPINLTEVMPVADPSLMEMRSHSSQRGRQD